MLDLIWELPLGATGCVALGFLISWAKRRLIER